VGTILPTKALLLRQIANGLPVPFRFRPAGDLATEIEWAKNRRIGPERYLRSLDGREPPIPSDLMLRVYREYERRKTAAGSIDFEDLLELAVSMFEQDERVRETFRAQYRAFTVDEYQDANALQQRLLDLWLGDRDDLCVVGDDYQSIYAFTGAGPEHLLGLPTRFAHALVVRLEENYRSTPQVLALANRLVPRLGGAEKVLRATRPDGPEPTVRAFATAEAEGAAIVEAIRAWDGPLEGIAILCRTNARLTDFEELLHDARIPFQGSSLLERDAARRLLRLLDRRDAEPAEEAVRRLALEAGWLPVLPEKLGERELVRQTDLARLVALASSFDGSAAAFAADLRRRFDAGGHGARGVNLLTLHRAKGLEFDAVFLPRLQEKELPARQARADAEIAEERRLLYVGITRARRLLWLSWSGTPSRFLVEADLVPATAPSAARGERRAPREPFRPTPGADALYDRLATWRRTRADEDSVPAYVVFDNRTLDAIARTRPATLTDLAALPGVGPVKLERYGGEVLEVVAADA
jgi:DNA helicase-2/ATP-dependent DNA helicase PcrA